MPLLICVAPGCDDLALPGCPHCERHDAAKRDKLAARRKAAQSTDHARAWRSLYQSRAWRAASRRFLRRNPLCADCGDLGAVVPAKVVDHIEPHKGDRRLFWLRSNWQALCIPCHNRKTAREVFHGQTGGGG
ncbi:HNH endonuclease [Loktanella sp. 3ANDIMAR09]|uniref:HNH endonuclease n=1 Tax=Loktanella sp. 3ANDIMAR09 TaxID=1225657 RepID=UPI0007003DB8|nr:HNH endonuclease signature motif containing protein [Loktanella sp. 3ANDIMAR09]KQI66956.1 HNH endonuclease [Loktanella sp. 3ANDIMAR09]